MNRLKKLLLVLPALILVVSCGDDFTILAPQSERNVENFYQTDTDFRVAINGAYAGLASNNLYGRNLMLLHEMRSDNTTNAGGATGLAESLERITLFEELPDATELENTWAGGYKVIASTNTILSRIDNVNFDNPALADRIRGEALFIRSLVYYNLAVTFGNIPIQLEEVTTPNIEINQVTADVIYDQIITDLGTAEGLLPASYSGGDVGRATSGAAATLLGLVHLTNGNAGQAETALRRVVNSQEYDLVSEYENLWGPSNENNIESIFEIQYKSGGQGTGSGFTEYYSPDLSISGGVGGGNVPQGVTDDLLDAYDETGDDRFNTIGLDEDGDEYLNKYDAIQSIAFDSDVNFVVFRYADVLLMLAEAIGESPEAYDLIDEVRERAGLTTPSATLPGTFEDILLHERRREFVGENKRWPDLLRFGVAQQVMSNFLSDQGVTPSDVRLLYPIPQRELDAAPGALEQNPL
ncbi:RagB/SusD family nutrient uptake outer membrane protein [Rhodohalobacter halophilus]|uniref:RagB/SusD family nutrient uptake outer membrane protein n=1 Tax=Rhodohalobacter halophilus TaxID=1812810 RepID=UPI00083F7B3B|nr:RagB/SusD family nutrient uptake outer membrane protein [Rhodohalobacter halophilus]